MPNKIFAEEEKKMVGVDLGPSETNSIMTNKTTESVASIFQANADFISHQDQKPVKRGLYDQGFDPNKAELDGTQFLLLDMRDKEDYELSHIKGAINYPAPNIARDKFIPQLFKFKNQVGKIIVVYT